MKEKVNAAWRRFLSKVPRLSRPWRIVRNVLCSAAVACLAWFLLGGPSLGSVWLFRQAEKLAMVGPSELLGVVKVPEKIDYYEKMVVGVTEEGICIYPRNTATTSSSASQLYYVEKQGTVTLFPAPGGLRIEFPGEEHRTAMLLFSDIKAARAEVDLTLGYINIGENYEHTYQLSGDVLEEGFFWLPLYVEEMSHSECDVLSRLASWHSYPLYSFHGPAYGNVRLYDENNELILETTVDLVNYDCETYK